MITHLKARPVAMVRAPEGIEGELFFQKHMDQTPLQGIAALAPELDPGHAPLMEVARREGLVAAAQMNTIEWHTWNARRDRIDRPDRMTFDLDPGEGVPWTQVQEAATLLHVLLQELELPAFLKTSGGKGLHVVVPIKRLLDWDTVKAFSQAVVQHLASTVPQRFVAKSGPRNRVGKIFVDYLRNGFGATTACAWTACAARHGHLRARGLERARQAHERRALDHSLGGPAPAPGQLALGALRHGGHQPGPRHEGAGLRGTGPRSAANEESTTMTRKATSPRTAPAVSSRSLWKGPSALAWSTSR